MRNNNFFEFSNNVKIIAGDDSIVLVAQKMQRAGGKTAILISDNNIAKAGHVQFVTDILKNTSKIEIGAVYLDISQSPTIADINKIFEVYLDNCCDCIIALGGSRVINAAKGLNMLVSTNSRNILDYSGIDCAVRKNKVPFSIISTTFGSGGEVSKTAIIIDEERKLPVEFVSDLIQPDYCVLNPVFLKTLPEKEIYLSLIDVMVYNVEAYISLRTNVMTQNFAKLSLFTIKNALQEAIQKKNPDALFDLQRAASMAGVAYSNAFVGLAHAIAHTLAAKYGIQHCIGVSCVIEACLKFYYDKCGKEYAQMLLYSLGSKEFATLEPELRGLAFINIFSNLIKYISKEFEVNTKLSLLGIKEENLEELANLTLRDGALITSPKVVTKNDILDILKQSM